MLVLQQLFNSWNCRNNRQLRSLLLEDLPRLSQDGVARDVFNMLWNLHTLKIRNCNFTRIPSRLFFQLENLKTLDLSHNKLWVNESDWFYSKQYNLLFFDTTIVKNLCTKKKIGVFALKIITCNKIFEFFY